MAISSTKVSEYVAGGQKHQIWNVTFASVTEGGIRTGLNQVLHANITEKTTEGQGIVHKNFSDNGTTAKAGDVYVYGVTSNDVISLQVVGY